MLSCHFRRQLHKRDFQRAFRSRHPHFFTCCLVIFGDSYTNEISSEHFVRDILTFSHVVLSFSTTVTQTRFQASISCETSSLFLMLSCHFRRQLPLLLATLTFGYPYSWLPLLFATLTLAYSCSWLALLLATLTLGYPFCGTFSVVFYSWLPFLLATLTLGYPYSWLPFLLASLTLGYPYSWLPLLLATLSLGYPYSWLPLLLATLPLG